MEGRVIDIERITSRVLDELAAEAVRSVINNQHAGYGIIEGVKLVITERAKEIVREPEFDAAIREQLRRWIKQ